MICPCPQLPHNLKEITKSFCRTVTVEDHQRTVVGEGIAFMRMRRTKTKHDRDVRMAWRVALTDLWNTRLERIFVDIVGYFI